MSLRDDILEPIAGDNPSGENLYYSPVYDQVKEARRRDDEGPQGDWERELKVADYAAVIRLAEPAIAEKSKDLQLAAWLGEALIFEEGPEGLRDSIRLMQGLIENFWDTLYPELEDGDAEFRAMPLEWFGNYFDPSKGTSPAFAIRSMALTTAGHGWFEYKESRNVPTEEEGKASESKQEARQAAIEEGKLTPEQFDLDFGRTPKSFYREMEAGLKAATEELQQFDDLCNEKFGDVAPGFRELRTAMEEVGASIRILLQEKLKRDPDPVEPDPNAVAEEVEDALEGLGLEEGAIEGEAGEGSAGEGAMPVALRSRQDAVRMLVAAAAYLRRSSPSDPVPYLLVRALRWGELRSDTGGIAATMLEAPSPEIRKSLRSLASAGDWGKVLETAEKAASGGAGRGWLDLHRYTIRACDELGYTSVARSLRTGLRALLADLPKLPKMTLADDTGTANPETLEWLVNEALFDPAAAEASEE